LALRSLDSVSIRPLAGTEGGFYPFWAADNQSVGFFAEGKLKRIDIASGLVRELANAPNPFGGAWGRDGTILFTPNATGSIFRIPATGGEPVAVTKIQAQQTSHGFPLILARRSTFPVLRSGHRRGARCVRRSNRRNGVAPRGRVRFAGCACRLQGACCSRVRVSSSPRSSIRFG
jgi:hypothetical protein